MKDEEKTDEQLGKGGIKEDQGTTATASDIQAAYGADEPWLPIETKMVVGSLIAGIIALVVLAALVHIFILGGQ